jgi:hypothetical protein
LRQAFEGDLAVAGLRALVAHDYPDGRAELVQQAGSLTRAHDGGPGYVKNQLHSGVGGVGVLPARSSAGAETPLELSGRDDKPATNPKAVLDVHHHHLASKDNGSLDGQDQLTSKYRQAS